MIMSKKKKHNKKRCFKTASRESKVTNPKTFFKSIGIKPPMSKHQSKNLDYIEKEISKSLGSEVANALIEKYNSGHHRNDAPYFTHSYLRISQLWSGDDLDCICRIANELMQLRVKPQSRILDIGGGPGHLAFWMAHIWPSCEITVADISSKTGLEWAKMIGEHRVSFVDAALPDLECLKDEQYDMILLSRVLGFWEELNLPSYANTMAFESYLRSNDGTELVCKLRKIAKSICHHLTKDGMLVVIDSWSDFRVLVVGRAFEQEGLLINLDLFPAEGVTVEHSRIVFTKSIDSKLCQDLPLGLSTLWNYKEGKNGTVYGGNTAESLRKVFRDAPIVFESEYTDESSGIKFQHEIVEIQGLSLLYVTDTDGGRMAILGSAISIPERIKLLEDFHK
jgi:SAM-dependent methyltransferase